MDLIHPQGASTAELFDSPGDTAQPKVLWVCLLFRMCVSGIEEISEVFLPLPNYRLS